MDLIIHLPSIVGIDPKETELDDLTQLNLFCLKYNSHYYFFTWVYAYFQILHLNFTYH